MKTHRSSLLLAAALCAAVPAWAKTAPPAAPKGKAAAKAAPKAQPAGPKPIDVAFQAAGSPAHFVTARPKGALDASGKSAGGGQTFQLFDLNGGTLKSGDKVRVELVPGGKGRMSFWRESGGLVNRAGGRPDASAVFTLAWKKPDTSLTLRTASGKFVSAPAGGGPLVTTAKAGDPTAVFTLVKKG